MEKKQKNPRRKAETAISPAPPLVENRAPESRGIPTEDVSLGRLSELADSARKKIIKSSESGAEGAVSAQAELLRSRNKVEEVRKRIQSGYYGQPDIIGRIIDKLADDLRP